MRPELEHLARIDSYLNNTMTAAESAIFEAEMANDPAMKEAVETQSLMITAINRKALMAQVIAATPPTVVPPRDGSILSKFKWPIILSSVVVGAIVTYFAIKGDDEEPQNAHENLHAHIANNDANFTNKEGLRASREADSNENNNVDFTYASSNTHPVSTKRHEFGGLETWVAPDLQKITINPTKEELIECADGTVIFIPKNAFVDSNGDLVKVPVTLEIIEALTMDKIVAYNLATMNGNNPLKTGGMVYVQPTLNGADLKLAAGKSIHIEIPTDEYDSNMQAWQGVPDGNGNLNWENPQEIENYLIPVAMSSLDFLPDGFREEVAATLPFKNYRTSSKELEDSLYYALGSSKGLETNTFASRKSFSTEQLDELSISEPLETSSNKRSNNNNDSSVSEVQPFQLPINVKSRKKNIYPLGQGPGTGLGAVKFENLNASKVYTATFNLNGTEYTTPIASDVIKTDLIGMVEITVKTAGCDPFLLNNVEISDGLITVLNLEEWNCDSNPKPMVKTIENCYINPSDIYAIQQPEFEETFIATKEFQERLQALHKIKNAQPLFDLYIQQLDKDLHVIDAQVAQKLTGQQKKTFEEFAAEKLTNVKPNGQEYDKLRELYTSKSKEQQQKIRREQQEYERKSSAELEAIQNELTQLQYDFNQHQNYIRTKYAPQSQSRGVSPPVLSTAKTVSSFQPPANIQNSRPQVGQQSSYKVNWYGTGWVNIDNFLHELSKGKKQIPINIADSEGIKVYQSVNSLNTLLTLNKTGEGFNAYFPTSQSKTFASSLVLGVSRTDDQLKVAAQFFNPYEQTMVTLNEWESVSEEEFKRRLKSLYPGGKQLLGAIKKEEKRIREAQERQRRAEEQRLKREKELEALREKTEEARAELQAKTEAIRMRQAAERSFIKHLQDFINPCSANYSTSKEDDPLDDGIVEFPDEAAEFPGGSVEFMRWITSNIQYPNDAVDRGIQGKIWVQFVVERDGSASNVKISNSDPETKLLEEEAVRLVQGMPPWKSAKVDGKKVRSHLRVPISFTLD
ncbi:MAG: TonB family protein [Fluviicola sp.]